MQAIKYLGVKDQPFKEKEKIFESINPYGSLILPKDSAVKNFFGFLLGKTFRLEKDGEFSLKVKTPIHDTKTYRLIAKEVKDLGYTRLIVTVLNKVYQDIRSSSLTADRNHKSNLT